VPLGSHTVSVTRLITTMASRAELQPCLISSGALVMLQSGSHTSCMYRIGYPGCRMQ
jgi:hypothetical protein